MKYGLSEEQLNEIVNILSAYSEIEEAILFGSRAIDTYKEASDVDIALKGEKVTASLAAKLKFEIEEDTYLPFFFDFVAYPTITNEELKKHINRKGIVLYRRVDGKKCESTMPRALLSKCGWTECKLGEAPLEIIDGDRGKNYPSQDEFKEGGHCLFLSTKNVRIDGFDFSECQFISKEKDNLLRKGKLQKNDIVLTTRGTVGNIGFFNDPVKFDHIRINSGMVIIRPNEKRLLPTFNYYIFRKLQSDFHTFVSGSAQPQLPIRDLKEVEISFPPLSEQRAIASVLSSLDDKIDLLHRQNKTLEAMAETLFRQWFVEEADEGWEEGKLGDIIELNYGKGLKNEIRTGTGFPVVGSSGIVGYHSEFFVEGPGIVIGRKGTLGKVIYLHENFFPIDTTYYVISKFNSAGLFYEYFLLKTLNFEEMNSDSAVPGLNREIALSTEINIPIAERLNEFNQEVTPLFEKVKINTKQIRTLEKLRDTLLPKLMIGEIRVNE